MEWRRDKWNDPLPSENVFPALQAKGQAGLLAVVVVVILRVEYGSSGRHVHRMWGACAERGHLT